MTKKEAAQEWSDLADQVPEPNATEAEKERGKKLRARISALNAFIDDRAPDPGPWEPPAITPQRKAELETHWKNETVKEFQRAAKTMETLEGRAK